MLKVNQFDAPSIIGGDLSVAKPSHTPFMADYGTKFSTFRHGALHCFLAWLFLALPIIGTNALFEKRIFNYTLVTGGFWIVCFIIMGGIICSWQ